MPTYASIGIWGAVLLTLLRFVQGIGVGGEWGGSVLLSMEWARTSHHRGFVASWPQFGVPSGLFLANLAVLAFSSLSGDAFATWGWRLAFLISIVLVRSVCGSVSASWKRQTFRRLVEENRIERAPVAEVFRLQAKEIFLSAFVRMAEQAPFYISPRSCSPRWGTLKVSRDLLLASVLVASVVSFFSIPIAGHLSDRFGRRLVYIIGAVATGVFGWIYFALLDTLMPFWIFVAIVVSLIPHDIMYGPQAALIAESFTGRLRYTGASIGYQLASIIAGGPAPLIAAALFAAYRSWVGDRCLYYRMCGHKRRRGGADARLHRQRHIGGIRVTNELVRRCQLFATLGKATSAILPNADIRSRRNICRNGP